MIYPGNFTVFKRKPELTLSWVILILNVFLFLAVFIFFEGWPSQDIRKTLNDEKFVNTVYEMYVQTLDPIEKKNLRGSVLTVYSRALKDQKFWKRVADYPFTGDRVRIAANKKVIKEFYEGYLRSPHYHFGLGALEVSPWSWVTYQFVHVSLVHLVGNLMLVFLIVSFLEKSVTPGWIAATYLFSGFAGGISFLFFDDVGGMSVIGASASASGLLSFLLITKSNQLMPWGFLISPFKNGFGQIVLPVFFIFPIFLLSDFISLLWEPSGIVSNVAVSAHVGGVLMGFIVGGYFLLFGSESPAHGVFGNDDGLHELF